MQTDNSSNPRPKKKKEVSPIATLEASLLTNNGKNHVVFSPNSKDPIPFETEIFIGHVMLIVRAPSADQQFNAFFDGKRYRL
jgi:hypothetical protein